MWIWRVVTTGVVSLNARLQGASAADKRDLCCLYLLQLSLAKGQSQKARVPGTFLPGTPSVRVRHLRIW
jgi:hypothetical protein